jgi:hypothetical protein
MVSGLGGDYARRLSETANKLLFQLQKSTWLKNNQNSKALAAVRF